MTYIYRRATEADIPFVVQAIIEAEKSGTEKLVFETVFGLSKTEVPGILSDMLLEDITGQELCYSDFLLACTDAGEPCAACAAWIEGSDNQSSSMLKASVLSFFIPRKNMQQATLYSDALNELHLSRKSGCIQIESVYTAPEHRGKGLSRELIQAHVANLSAESKSDIVQIILAKDNNSAYKAYQKLGFEITQEKISERPELAELLPSTTKIMMQLTVSSSNQ